MEVKPDSGLMYKISEQTRSVRPERLRGLLCFDEGGQLRNSSKVYVSVEVKVKADLRLSPSHEEACRVTPLICSNLLWDDLSSMHICRMYDLMHVQSVLLLLL